ncbi:MAG: pyridoxine 5'-phosphate synthase [Labilithrix sp.]|nr:pyridoxine 5'-phosphate synthase [Labilithrix sp.]MCW5831183.1 pyridoxine 5'-phosphate synthase [Labilithrix sp.]MCW5838144.1 pyridoxine 5'-phosphate synthase [Labilithrix sp.]
MRLHINIDHVATLRNARGTPYPDPVEAARVCLDAGAHGITAHLREDRRHIGDQDVERLRATLRATFNLECAATDEMIGLAVATRPDVVTLVPERRAERTTEGGLDVAGSAGALAKHVDALQAADIKVSLFIAPDPKQVEASRALGVEQIELHTGEYAHAFGYGRPSSSDLTRPTPDAAQREHVRLAAAAKMGHELGLEIAAGHGLTTRNVGALVLIQEIVELNIGHAVIADAVFMSLGGAVKAMLGAIGRGRPA